MIEIFVLIQKKKLFGLQKAVDPAKTFVYNNRKNELEKTDAKYVQAIYTSSISQNIDVHCKVFINRHQIAQPGCEKMGPLTRNFCSHTYAIYLYDEIGAGWKLMATKENEKSEMMVGHLSHENAIGVFDVKTDYYPGMIQDHENPQHFLNT